MAALMQASLALPRPVAGRAQGIALILVTALPILALQALVPDLPQLIQHFQRVPHSDFLVPMVLTVPALCIALCSSLAGLIADLWSRRGLLLLALSAYGALGMAPLWFPSLTGLFVSRVGVGLAEACAVTAASSLLGDYFDDSGRKRWVSYQQMVTPCFAAFAYLAGGQLAAVHWQSPCWIYAFGFIGFAIAASSLRATPRAPLPAAQARGLERFPWRATAVVCIGTLLVSLAFWTQIVQHGRIFSALGVHSPAIIGRLTMLAGLSSIGGALLFRHYMHKRVAQLLGLMLGLYAICYLGLAFCSSVATGLPIDAIGMIASGLMVPTCVPWALRQFPAQHRGRGIGVYTASFYMGQFISAPLATVLERAGGGLLKGLGILGTACLIASVLLLLLDQRRQPLALLRGGDIH